jgi:hypothetical protein
MFDATQTTIYVRSHPRQRLTPLEPSLNGTVKELIGPVIEAT